MKYTIELTTAERDVVCDIINTIRCNSLGEYRLFENTTLFRFDEKSTDYDAVYRRGIEDGNKMADKDLEEIHDTTYAAAYNKALKDVNHAMDVLKDMTGAECAEWFEDCVGVDEVVCGFCVQRIIEITKAYEEKKKAEEKIKVGDIVYYEEEMLKAIVLDIVTGQGVTYAVMLDENGLNINEELSGLKFIEHTNEVEQLLDKLRGEEK